MGTALTAAALLALVITATYYAGAPGVIREGRSAARTVHPAPPQPDYGPQRGPLVSVTLPPEEMQGAGVIAMDDYISVLATVNLKLFSPASDGAATRTVFSMVYVIGVGPSGDSMVGRSLTVLMTPCDAEYMVWFWHNSTLRYSLIAIPDYPASSSVSPCTSPPEVGPAQVDARWHFSAG